MFAAAARSIAFARAKENAMTHGRPAVVAALCLILLGCSTAATTAKPPSVDVTGKWAGTFTWPYGTSPIIMSLKQQGADVDGQIEAAGTIGELRQRTGPVRGTVSGDALSITFAGGSADLFVRDNRMSGVSSAGSTWNLQRQ
jgi:hypothetical protein